jgi:hypothetical protein
MAALPILMLHCCIALAADREKSDVIVLHSGDRITGEILSLEYGILKLKTSKMSTISIEWPAVETVTSKYGFFVERSGGRRYYGVIQANGQGQFSVKSADAVADSMPMLDVMRLSQVEQDFWSRIDGAISFGLNYTKSSAISTGSFALNMEYSSPRIESALAISAQTTKSPGQGRTDRDLISNSTRFMRSNQNYWVVLSSLERNEELGIDGRLQLGAAVGRHFLQRSTSELTGIAGLSVNQEWVTGSSDARQSVEGVLGAEWRIFKFSDPETTLDSSLRLYPGITESGRWRSEFSLVLSRELFSDFTVSLSYYNSYDSRPPDADSARSDYGVVTSVGYKF